MFSYIKKNIKQNNSDTSLGQFLLILKKFTEYKWSTLPVIEMLQPKGIIPEKS